MSDGHGKLSTFMVYLSSSHATAGKDCSWPTDATPT